MSLRHGVSIQEENKLKVLASQGKSWSEIVELCATQDERGREQAPLLLDVEMSFVKKFYESLCKKHEEAKKAGHPTIHAHEAAIASKKRAEAAAKKKDE